MIEPEAITFEVDSPRRLRRATYRGVITDAILFRSYERLLSDPGYDPMLNDLVDLRAVERLELGSTALRQFVRMFSQQGLLAATRLAIVAPTNHVFGMARMYEILSDGTPEQIHVFREMSEAEVWLGLEHADEPQ